MEMDLRLFLYGTIFRTLLNIMMVIFAKVINRFLRLTVFGKRDIKEIQLDPK